MASENARILEGMMFGMLHGKYSKVTPTEHEFAAEAEAVRQSLNPLYPVADEEFEQIIRNLQATLLITMDKGIAITDPNSTHQSWVPGRRGEASFFYWSRYKKYLELVKGWNPTVVGVLDRVSDEILDYLGDPKSSMPWRRRGLVIGDVQSGKTVNYTAICNKAADYGYKVIIVMAGTTHSLRRQTQERLDLEFAGLQSQHLFDREAPHVFDGVGKMDPSRRIDAFTSVNIDFNSFILKNHGMYLKNSKEPALFVVKKNSAVLKNLEKWLRLNNADPTTGKIDMPLLLIDDEADNASVNTKKPDEHPTAVNGAIRSILKGFTKATYLGITATPFANIFIDPDTTDQMAGDDLFPQDFIYLLYPPSNYIGADRIYGDDASHKSCLVEIEEKEMKGFFPFKHKKDHAVDALPPSLVEAMRYFVLVNAIRDDREGTTGHRSMLINVSRFTGVQMRIKELVDDWLYKLRSDIDNYAALDEESVTKIPSLKALRTVWDKYNLELTAGFTWLQLRQQYLRQAIGPIEARAVNSSPDAKELDYSEHPEGLRVIAVGGNNLSRGLTLEGLCVSYIHRNSMMYDTLLQMGRWFGYRPNYDDLCKVWMAEQAIPWYRDITEATTELKSEIRRMNRSKLTPKDFGLKVRQHPGSLTATARNKMRTATKLTRPISVQGRSLETPRLKSKPAVLEANKKAFELFVANLDSVAMPVPTYQNGHLWTGVPKRMVTELLRDFDTHPWHMSFHGPSLADFIDDAPHLADWTVVIPDGSGDIYALDSGSKSITVLKESRKVEEADGMIKIMGDKVRVGSGGCTRAGLTDEQITDARRAFFSDPENAGKTNVPDNAYLIKGRKPLLMLHVIQSDQRHLDQANPKVPDVLFAIGIGLPATGEKEKTATYAINLVEAKAWMDMDEYEDDEDAD